MMHGQKNIKLYRTRMYDIKIVIIHIYMTNVSFFGG